MTRDEVADTNPVARVVVDVAHAHLDRPFDYLVPKGLGDVAHAGTRVRVRFAGRLINGFILERCSASPHQGRLAFLDRVVSPEVVLTAEVLALARAVAQRWAGSLYDVLRLAVPPRHARAEVALPPAPVGSDTVARLAGAPEQSAWSRYRGGRELLESVRGGGAPRVVWAALPDGGADGGWPGELAELIAAAVTGGRGALVIAPDARDVKRLDEAVSARLGAGTHVVLTAELGPAERYRRFLAVSRGQVRVVVGNRGAAFAPVADLGLVVIWDDGDDLHAEPRAPYPHAREVLMLRAQQHTAAAVVAGYAVTAEGARLVATRWAHLVAAERSQLRAAAPRVVAAEDAATGREPAPPGRLPTQAWKVAHDALRAGAPVLVQVPRSGYLPALACETCRTLLRCAECGGPLASAAAAGPPSCRWCGRLAGAAATAAKPGDRARGWRCPECGGTRFRAVVVGARRTAEELGRAFPGFPVRTSAHGQVVDSVGSQAAVVVATPGAEPIAAGGYGAALLLDGWALLGRADLRAAEEALRRWFNAAALVRPAAAGGRVVVLAASRLRPVQALVRWDPAGHAERELADRRALGFPPAAVFAELVGGADAVREFLGVLVLPAGSELLGPVPLEAGSPAEVRALIRGPRTVAADLAARLHEAAGGRSARKLAPVRIRVDPQQIG